MNSQIKKRLSLNAYAIFVILERQRNLKLRELYRNNHIDDRILLPMISEESCSDSPETFTSTATSSPSATITPSRCSLRQATKKKKKYESPSPSMSTLPRFPPRYAALSTSITSEVLMMQLQQQTISTTTRSNSRHRSSPTQSMGSISSQSFYMNEYKSLDQATIRFLHDTVQVLQDRCNEEIENNETKLEIHMRRGTKKKTRRSLFECWRVEKKLSLIVD